MKLQTHVNEQTAANRIIALWALSEAGFGGVLHAFNIPFSGLIISGLSVMFISIFTYFSGVSFKAIFKATIIVLVLKMLISPHSPAAAYFAVLFQGVLGGLIFSIFRFNRFSILLLTLISLVESGFQKIVVLTIFYGVSIWKSISIFTDYVAKQLGFLGNYEAGKVLIIVYLVIHLIGGVIYYFMIIRAIHGLNTQNEVLQKEYRIYSEEAKTLGRKKRKIGRRTRLILILLFIISIIFFIDPSSGWEDSVYIFLRAIFVVVIWYSVFAPIMKKLFEQFLKRQKKKLASEISETMAVFPQLKQIVWFAWEKSDNLKGFGRLNSFINMVIYLALNDDLTDE